MPPNTMNDSLPATALSFTDRIDKKVFDALYSRSLIYNTCWEDPAVDRQILNISSDDSILVITSAGCNALDYAIQGPKKIFAIDANPRQSALLELKIAAIKHLQFEDFFAIFGKGHHPDFVAIYRKSLRPHLSAFTQKWWDKHSNWFTNPKYSFYYHGLSGLVARLLVAYLRMRPKLRSAVHDMLDSQTLDEQRKIYDERVAPEMWNPGLNWLLSRQITMSLLGVPSPQRRLVQAQHEAGVAGFIRESVEYVFRELPVQNNYFWRVYVKGAYTPECCPEYLKPENFELLKQGRVDCIELHTQTVTEFLMVNKHPISRFILLDHMDWMSTYYPDALNEEWNGMIDIATPNARFLMRSAHARPEYLDWIRIGADRKRLHECLTFHDELAVELTKQDRVHTYAGCFIADVKN